MKTLTFDPSQDPKHARHFELAYVAANSQAYQFQGRDEMRHHGKLLDALEALSVEDKEKPSGRRLKDGPQQLVVDDAWLALLKKMATPPNTMWLAATTRDANAMLDYLDSATDYVPPAEPKTAPAPEPAPATT